MANQIKYQVGFDVNKSNLDSLKKSLQQIQQLSTKDLMKLNNSSMEEAKQALLNIKNQAINVEKALRQAFNTKLNTVNISEFNKSLTQSKTTIQNVYAAFSKAGPAGQNAFRSLSAQVLSTNIQLRQSNGLLSKMATTFANTIKWNIASSAINAMSRSIQQAWGFTKDLDTSLNDIRIVTGKSADEMADFAVQANKAAQNLGQTTTDYTKASLIYYQQGLQDAEVQARTDVTLKAANVTGQSAQQVSEQLTAVWNGYKVSAEQTEVYIDRLAAVAATSASNLEELSTGMSKVASAAAAMGVGEEQLAAQLSTIISVTRQAPQSVGTALRTIFARVADIKAGLDQDGVTLGNYSSKMAELGISVLDMNGNLRDMGEVMEQIGAKWADMSRQQQVYLARTMAGQRQYNNLLALFDNFDMYNKQLEVAQNATGTLQKQQDTYMESTEAHLKQLRASMEGIYEKLFNTEGINKLIDNISLAAKFMAQFVSSIGGGGNLLRSLGSIGMMVFSEQIARGINTAITNLEVGKQNVAQFNAALEATRQWQGIPGLDQLSTKLLENREQLLSFAGLLNPQQFTGLQSMLNEMTQAVNEFSTLSAEQGFLNEAIEQVGKLNTAWKDLNTIMKDDAAQQAVIDKIKQQEIAFHNVIDEIKNYHKNLSQIKTQAFNGEDVTKNLTTMKAQLNGYIDSLSKLTNEAGLTKHTQQLEKLKARLTSLSEDIPVEEMTGKFRDIAATVGGIAKSAEQAGADLRGKLAAEFQGTVESIGYQTEEAKTKVKSLGDAWEQEVARMQRASSIEIFTRVTGSITSLAMAVRNFKSLGGIWLDKDISVGEKILQTITNLGMAVGMVIPAYQKLNAVYTAHATTVTFLGKSVNKETAERLKNIIATGLQNKEDEKVIQEKVEEAMIIEYNAGNIDKETMTKIRNTMATKGAKAANEEFKASLLSNPFTAIAIAILAVVTAVFTLTQALKKANEELGRVSGENISKENSIQQELQQYKELYKELEQLDNRFKQHQISRISLKHTVEDLIDQYQLEGEAADKLRKNYDNLAEGLKEVREETANSLLTSANKQLADAENLIKSKSKETKAGTQLGNTFALEFGTGDYSQVFHSQNLFQNALAGIGGVSNKKGLLKENSILFKVDFDPQSIVNLYDQIYDVLYGTDSPLNDLNPEELAEIKADQAYIEAVDWVSKMTESVAQYKAAIEDVKKYSAELTALTNNINFSETDDFTTYLEKRQFLIQRIQTELQKTAEEAEAMADTFLSTNYRDLFVSFNEGSKYIEDLRTSLGNLGTEAQTTVENILNLLNPEQLTFITDINSLDITSWEDLLHILEYMQKTDLSNLTIVNNTKQSLNAAVQQYATYSKLNKQNFNIKQKTINDEEYEKLAPGIQEFFTLVNEGTYKMLGDAKQFYDAVNELSVAGFKKNIENLRTSSERLSSLKDIDYEDLTRTAEYDRTQVHNGVVQGTAWNQNQTSQQLDYLTESGYDLDKIIQWKAELSDGSVAVNTLNDIAAAVQDTGNKTEEFNTYLEANRDAIYQNQLAWARSAESTDILKQSFSSLDQSLKNGQISQEDYNESAKALTQAMIELDQAADLEGLDSKELNDYSKYLQKVAKSSSNLSNELETNDEAAEIVAKSIMKMNDGVEALEKNWDDWSDVLKNSSEDSQEYASAMGNTQEALSDLLDVSQDYVSADFIKNHLDEISAAAQGSEEAIDGLKNALAQDIFARILLDNQITPDVQNQLLSDLANLQASIPDMEVGATLETGDFIDQANQLLQDCNMTVDQANAMFDALGFEANFATQPQQVEQRVPKTVTKTEVTGYTTGTADMPQPDGTTKSVDWSWPILSQSTYNDGYEVETGIVDVPAMATNGKTPIINSITKKPGGSYNNSSKRNAGGSGGGKGSGGGGGGGSGKGSESDKSQKDRKKPVEDTRDIYHDINIQLKQIERQLNRVQDIQDRLYGKQLLDNLNKQTEILEKQKKKLEEKRKIQLQDLADQRNILTSLGVTFDAYDNISNYMSRLAAGQKEINKLTDQYNALVDKYNASTDKDYKKTVADEIDEFSKKLKEAEDNYKELEEKIKDYDSLREDMEDLVDDIDEIVQQEVELNITRFNMQLDIRLNMAQAERDWNEFKRNVIYKDNILKDTEFDTIFKDAMHSLDDVYTYFSTAGSKSIIQNLTEQLLDTRTEIEAIDSKGWSEIYGDDKAQAMENLKDNFDELIGQMQDMEELINEIDEAYLDTIDDVKDQFDKQIEDYEFIGELLQHDMDLLELLYGDKNYAAMDRYYAQLNQNNLQQLDSLRKQAQLWYEYWQAAVAEGNVADATKFEENYREAISNLNSLIEESAENLKDKYINSIEQIFDELDRKISNGKGTDYLSMEWDLMNKNADEYLDTINSAFAVQELQSKYQKAINDTKNIRNQQTLKKLMDAQLENLRAKEKLTQYDVERAEKLLQIEQARMALQDAKASKTTMRLKRNAQGNYSYEYVADNSGVAEAQDALAAAQNDLYNFDKDRYNSNLEDILAAWKDFQSEYKEIIEDASLTEEDRVARLALLREEYGEYINDKTAENLVIRNNLMESAFMDIAALYNVDVENYQQMADDEKEILMGDLVPTWKSGIQEMTNTVVGSGGFLPVCEKAFDNITKATQKYERQLETMSRVAGTNLNMVKNGIDILADSTKTLIDDNDALIDRLTDEIDTIKDLKLEVENLRKQYEDVTKEANKAADAIHNFIKAQEDQAAKEAEKNKKAQAAKQNTSGSSGTGSGSGSGSTGSSSSSGSGSTSSSSASTNRSKYLDYTFKNNWPGRDFYLSGKYVGSFNGSGFTTKDAEIIQDMIDNGIWGKNYSAGAWPIYKSKTKTIDELLKSYGLKTGGYTGDWAGDSGRLALLHQKELVLNQEDTQNILDSVTILRQLLSSATGNIANRMFSLNNKNSIMQSLFGEGLEQNVHIDATFPNVNSKKEIEDALNEIINLAAQKALK